MSSRESSTTISEDRAVVERRILRVRGSDGASEDDWIAVEEPLEIRLGFRRGARRIRRSLAITMRTPGSDHDLALGFLFAEGVIDSIDDVVEVVRCGSKEQNGKGNVLRVELEDRVVVDMERLARNVYTTSSCGLCGKSSLDALASRPARSVADVAFTIDQSTLCALPERLRGRQEIFATTGGLHAVARFDEAGSFEDLCEDVGRHNAFDKMVGRALRQRGLPAYRYGALLSGRASFELVQKALFAGLSFVAAIGAPSSAAIELAVDADMTLVGFLGSAGFNVYAGAGRIKYVLTNERSAAEVT